MTARPPAEPPTEDLLRYDVMVQEALIGVVRKVLIEVSRTGLPGDHHFYITFRSEAPGVRLSQRLREKYPEEMTVVLQHQFWDLVVSDQAFEVGLSFGGIAERLVVPFDALTGFYDPSVQFGLKFTPDEAQADNDSGEGAEEPGVKEHLEAISTLETRAKAPAGAKEKTGEKARRKAKTGEPRAAGTPAGAAPEPPPDGARDESGKDNPPAGAEVVSLEAFRKKK